MSTQNHEYQIVNGPNRNDFVDAFLYAFDGDIGLNVAKYTITSKNLPDFERKVSIKLKKIAHEDGSGKKFIFEGECYYGLPRKLSVSVKGFYDAGTRKGNMETTEGISINM